MEFTTNETREQATGFGTIAFNYPVTTADLKAHSLLNWMMEQKSHIR